MNPDSRIYIAGHRGLVGSALVRKLTGAGYKNLLFRPSGELDLRQQKAVEAFFDHHRPEFVFLAAAKVGGILANSTYKAEFLYDNLMIAANVVHASRKFGAKKLLNLGSSCIYPKTAPQPLKEEYLLTGPLEPTNEPYAVAKIAAVKLCRYYNEQFGTDYLSVMPTNLYGPNDNFDLETSHVLPALLRKTHEAKTQGKPSITVWGTGEPRREFLHVDDLAEACLLLMKTSGAKQIGELINVGTGSDLSIRELAELVKRCVQYEGDIVYDRSKPDGAAQKLMDVSKIRSMGWAPKVPLEDGIRHLYVWFRQQADKCAGGRQFNIRGSGISAAPCE